MTLRPDCPRILMAGGGTGGHVYPALAIADAVVRQEPAAVIEFAGTRDRMEWEVVPRGGYAIHPIQAAGFSRTRPVENLALPVKLARGLVESLRLVGDFDADVVVGTGGFVAGPVGLAAALRGRPLLLQEQNALPGVTNRLLGRFASRIHVAFEEAERAFPRDRCVRTGNPVREGIDAGDRNEARTLFGLGAHSRVLVVLGGSLGSQALNEAVRDGVRDFVGGGDIEVLWQTGDRYFDRMAPAVDGVHGVRVARYLERMDLAYAAADLALCRAGASTCAELLATGTPAILVPSPNVAEDHQTHNAASMARLGAARLVPEDRLRAEWVSAARGLLDDRTTLASMRESGLHAAVRDAAALIARDVLDLASRRAA